MLTRCLWSLLLCSCWRLAAACVPCTYTAAGEIVPILACTGICDTVDDRFALLLLCDAQQGRKIFVSDCGWKNPSSEFRTTEGFLVYELTTDLPAGSAITGYPTSANWPNVMTGGNNGFAKDGEQLLIGWGDDPTNPDFTYGIALGNDFQPDSSAVDDSGKSHVPPGIPTTYINALQVNQKYDGVIKGTAGSLLASVQDPANWATSTSGLREKTNWEVWCEPTTSPTVSPTLKPTLQPTNVPSSPPSLPPRPPSASPSHEPSVGPTKSPLAPTVGATLVPSTP
eukprot:Hpha_TRINITY_DN17845_c0_g1::TRINITY_DN17845_c0_g1_i1::g.177593::m.177593